MNFSQKSLSVGAAMRRFSLLMALMCACVFSMQARTFKHQTGDGTFSKTESTTKQSVHEDVQIIYAKPGDVLTLESPSVAFANYIRWYLYDSDAAPVGTFSFLSGSGATTLPNETSGLYAYATGHGALKYHNVSYTYPSSGGIVKVACDESTYTDYTIDNNTILEPTLSNRVIYEIHPATEMTARMKNCTNDNWFYEQDLIAPTGATLFIGPQYAYRRASLFSDQEENYTYFTRSNYFYGESSPVQMGANSSITYKVGNTTYTEKPSLANLASSGSGSYNIIETSNGGYWYWKKVEGAGSETDFSFEEIGGQYIKVSQSTAGKTTYLLRYAVASGTLTKTTKVTVKRTGQGTNANPYIYTETLGTPTTTGTMGTPTATYNVAKLVVNYKTASEVGPAIIPNPSWMSKMKWLGGEHFNFEDSRLASASGTDFTDAIYYAEPFSAPSSTFGFYYKSSVNSTSTNRSGGATGTYAKPYYNEYALVNNGYGWGATSLANHVGDQQSTNMKTGFAVYVDGSQKPGQVFSLPFEASLCPGAKMYFSAFVGDHVTTTDVNKAAVLDFVVVGVLDGVETDIATFTTGAIVNKSGWQRVFFPLEFPESVDYDSYLLRIVNRAASSEGNDFFIDDIDVYLMPAPIQPIQASSFDNCLEEGTANATVQLYTRIDFSQVSKLPIPNSNTSAIYYRWENGDYQKTEGDHSLATATYINPDGINYGKIIVPNNLRDIDIDSDLRSHIKASLEAFDREQYDESTPAFAFVKEDCYDITTQTTVNRYVIYVATPVTIVPGNKYSCRISENTEFEGNSCSDAVCITTASGLRVQSNGTTVTTQSSPACANYAFDLKVKIEYSQADYDNHESGTATAYYKAHWLFGKKPSTDDEKTAFLALYGHTYDRIKDALDHQIDVNYRNNEQGYDYDEDDEAILERLHQQGLLVWATDLESEVYTVMPLNNEPSLTYTAFPVERIEAAGPNCFNPVSITLQFPEGTSAPQRNVIKFVKEEGEVIPAFVSSRPRRVRVPVYKYGTTERQKEQEVLIELTNIGNHYSLSKLTLYSTDDKTADNSNWTYSKGDVVLGFAAKRDNSTVTDINGKGNSVVFSDLDKLNPGKQYTFKLTYELKDPNNTGLIETSCGYDSETKKAHEGEAYITFIIVPDMLHYIGASDSAWNDDYNWREQIAPLKETSVVYNTGNHILINPVAPETDEEKLKSRLQDQAVEPKALSYITFDINYEPYKARRVHVPAGTALAGQQNIKSTDAWSFDMKVVPNQWNMTAMPVKGVVTGDMFIPSNVTDESNTEPFKVTRISQDEGEALDRLTNKFYCSMYNSSVVQREPAGDIAISSSTWSYASNALATELKPGTAWSLGLASASGTHVMRLPKNETVYNYYRTGYWVSGVLHEDITRSADYGKPAFTGEMSIDLTNMTASRIFLLGNPTFAYLDLAKLAAVNTDLSGIFYLSGLQNTDRYNHVTNKYTEAGWLSTLSALETADNSSALGLIAPMEGVLLQLKEDVGAKSKLSLTITPDMLVTSDGYRELHGSEIPTTTAPRRVAAALSRQMHISALASNFKSNALLVENPDADNAALESEDAEVFLLDQNKTPFTIYTVASDKALAINQVNDEATIIPLAMYAQTEIASENLTFTGDDAFLSEWDLIDNASNTREQLFDGFTSTLHMDNTGAVRYYLEHARHNAPSADNSLDATETSIHAYTRDGLLTVFSADEMHDFRLYDAAGRLVASLKNAGRQQDFSLVKGVYVVRANGDVVKVVVK